MRNRPFLNKSSYFSLLIFAALFTLRATDVVQGSEFSGGRVTGPVLRMSECAVVIFAVAAIVAFMRLRVAAVMTFVASSLALPFLICILAPGPFRDIFPGHYSVPLQTNFAWQAQSAIALLTLLVAVLFSGWILYGNAAAKNLTANI